MDEQAMKKLANDFALAFAQQSQDLSPWSQQFPEPIFDGKF